MKKIVEYFAKNKLVVNIITLLIFLIGVGSLLGIKQDLFPDASTDAVIVAAVYPGASARDVELQVIVPIEKEIKSINGIKTYSSIAMENSARILVEIDEKVKDTQAVKDTLYRELTSISDLPDEVDKINIVDMDPSLLSIYEIGVYRSSMPISGEDYKENIMEKLTDDNDKALIKEHLEKKKGKYYIKETINKNDKDRVLALFTKIGFEYKEKTEQELYTYIDSLEKQLLKVDGVSDIRKSGYRDREIKINVIPEKMNKFYISLSDIVNSIKSRNIRVPGGTLDSSEGEYSLVTLGEFEDPAEVGEVIIRSNYDSKAITIDDIADVKDGFKKENIVVRVDQHRGVTLDVVKKSNADIVKTAGNVKAYLGSIENDIPDGFTVTSIKDTSFTISNLLDIVKFNALIGFILVFILLLVFLLDFKTAFWTAFGIPITMLITFTVMRIMDYSINIISLGAISMLLGIIVDDSIVVSESIFKFRAQGYDSVKAAYLGVKEVAMPVIVSILTTIVAFIPLFLITGMMGKFIFILPMVVVIALLASLLEALVFLPAHLSHSKKKDKKSFDWFSVVERGYKALLKGVLKLRYLVILLFVGLFIMTIYMSQETLSKFVMADDDSADVIMLKLETDPVNTLYKTSEHVKGLEQILYEEISASELISIKSVVGHHNANLRVEEGYHTNWALVTINLVPNSDRERNADRIMTDLRKRVNSDDLPQFTEITMVKEDKGPNPGRPVNVQLIGNNDAEVMALAGEIKEYLGTIDGVINIEDDYQLNKNEMQITFDYDRMARLGINVQAVSQTIRTAFEGSVATSIQTVDQELDFRVMIGDDSIENKNEDYLLNLLVPNNRGRLIKLKEIARLETKKTLFAINHQDGDRAVQVTADIDKKGLTSMIVMNQIKEKFSTSNANYPGVVIEYVGESAETRESLGDLGIAFLVAVVLIYLLLILLFKNLSQPLLIMLTIPFGIIGALLAFMLHGMPLSFFGMVGVIGLSGVVVNDCIVMVDFINKTMKRSKGDKLIPMIVEGAKERLRPVMLTTLTTTVGLLPTAYGFGGSSPLITPVAIALAYGLLFATLLTLIFIPSIYLVRMDIINLFARIFKRGKGKAVEIEGNLGIAPELVEEAE